MVIPNFKREQVETVDGRIYFSDDGWETVYRRLDRTALERVTDKEEADLARFLAITQAGPGS